MKIDDVLQVIDKVTYEHGVHIGERHNISEAELADIIDAGVVTLGAHAVNHPVLSNETGKRAQFEIDESITSLAEMIGQNVKYFAFPNGIDGMDQGPREQRILEQGGIKLSFTTKSGYVNGTHNPYFVPRVCMAGFERRKVGWILSKLALAPVWDQISRGLRLEIKERREIMNL